MIGSGCASHTLKISRIPTPGPVPPPRRPHSGVPHLGTRCRESGVTGRPGRQSQPPYPKGSTWRRVSTIQTSEVSTSAQPEKEKLQQNTGAHVANAGMKTPWPLTRLPSSQVYFTDPPTVTSASSERKDLRRSSSPSTPRSIATGDVTCTSPMKASRHVHQDASWLAHCTGEGGALKLRLSTR